MRQRLFSLIAAALGLACAQTAAAADPTDFEGRYLGFSLTAQNSLDEWIGPAVFFSGDTNGPSLSAGVYTGKNFVRGGWIVGYEVGFEIGDGGQSSIGSGGGVAFGEIDFNWQATARARFGKVFNQSLLYGAFGASFANYNLNYHIGTPLDQYNDTLAGLTLAVGLERMLNETWRFRAEVSHTEYASSSGSAAVCCGGGIVQNHDVSAQALRLGLSLDF